MKSLIVEDDFTSRVLLQSVLSRYGECHIAVNGREAVQAFQDARNSGNDYDFICMDIVMPELDGQQALQQIRTLEHNAGVLPSWHVKVLMITALDDPKSVMGAFYQLCDAYLCKPIDVGKLQQHLRELGLVNDPPQPAATPAGVVLIL